MKKIFSAICFLACLVIQAQTGTTVALTLGAKSTYYRHDMKFAESADSAFKITSWLLSSQEFRDSIKKLAFPANNYCRGYGDEKNIPGDSVLKVLYSQPLVTW